MYAEDIRGATPGQNIANDLANATGMFHNRTVELGTWDILGEGICGE